MNSLEMDRIANVIVTEVQRTWNRPDAAQYGELHNDFAPHYRALVESYQKAQEVVQVSR